MVRADIVHRATLGVIDSCHGPNEHGGCSRPAEDGTVPCAGTFLDAEAASVGWSLRIPVAEHATACPLRCFVVESVAPC